VPPTPSISTPAGGTLRAYREPNPLPAEPLGTLDALIRARGHRIRFHNFERDPDAQPTVDRYKGLIVLGGTMNVEDQHRRPHLKTEMLAIEQALAQGKPVLGICLGAQLLAHVLGASIRRHEVDELGWYDLNATPAGRDDAVLGVLGERRHVFQWHSYTYDLPAGAEHLARTTTCEQQAFRYGENAYGFQFHLEADAALIDRWLRTPAFREQLAATGRDTAEDAIRAATAAVMTEAQRSAAAVFNNFLDLIGRPNRRIALPSRGMPALRD
jgi:GMP synthase (glutamine-hydrolysing)